jgi:hypothetical protein
MNLYPCLLAHTLRRSIIDRLGKSRHNSNLIMSGEISSAKQKNWRLDKKGAVNSLSMNALPVTGFVFKVSIIAPGLSSLGE